MKAKTVIVLASLGLMATLVTTGTAILLLSTRSLPNLLHSPHYPWLVFGNALADSLIALSYIAIFLSLFWLGDKLRRLPGVRRYMWVCASFGIFILASGATHAMQGVVLWLPLYGLSFAVKLFSATAAIVVACLLISRISKLARNIERLFALLASEHRQAEALRRSEALLERTNRVAGIGGWELDLIKMDLTWSSESARIHGLPPGYKPQLEEAIGYFGRSHQPMIRTVLQRVIDGGSGWDLELPLHRVDGRKLWVRLIGEPEKIDGKPVRLFGSVQDRTEDVEQREALRRSQVFLDRTNHVAGIGGWEFDIATKDLVWSDQTARIHGRPPGHKPTYEESFTYFPVEYHPYIKKEVDAAFATGGIYDLELPLVRPSGQRIWVRLVGEVQLDDGKPSRIYGSLQDKTFEVEQRETLRKSQNFLDRTNRIAGVGGWEVDILTNTVTWSAETYRIHALPESYRPSIEAGLSFYAPEGRPIIAAAVQRAFETGEGWDLELEFNRADDKQIWVRTVGNVEIVDGKPLRLIGAIQDKTSQVHIRLALMHAKERISIAADSGGIAVWDWDLKDDNFICDASMFRLYDVDFKDGLTPISTWSEKVHPDDWPLVLSNLMDAIEDRKPYDMEFRVVWKDASVHILKATGRVIRDENGRALRMIGTNRDVTETRRLAAEFAEQHELLRVTLLSIRDAVVSMDVDGNIVWWNGAAERLTALDTSQAIGKHVSSVFNVVYEETRLPVDILTDLESARAHGVATDAKILLISQDGVQRNIESCATPIYDIRSTRIGSVLVLRDVTEQFRLARETEQNTKLQLDLRLKDEFLSHVSHELRSPLTSVYSFTSIIADNLAGDTTEEQQQYLQIVLKNVLQLQAMIEDLLTVTQSKGGRVPIDAQEVAIAQVVLDAVNTSRPAAAMKKISIASMEVGDSPLVLADPTRLCQIMIILLDNAIKFTPEGGHIDLRVVEDGNMLRFEVEDNGCGIPLEKRARVFEKLYQITGPELADTSLAGRIGLGLGLHIARDLVRRQGGNIWVTGAPEQGSIFTFTLPLAFPAGDFGSANGPSPRRRKTDWPVQQDDEFPSAA